MKVTRLKDLIDSCFLIFFFIFCPTFIFCYMNDVVESQRRQINSILSSLNLFLRYDINYFDMVLLHFSFTN